MTPKYLGDGVYISDEDRGLVLTSGHHDPQMAAQVIYLDEPGVVDKLLNALTEWKKEKGIE